MRDFFERLKLFYRKEQFKPSKYSVFINSNYFSLTGRYNGIKKYSTLLKGKVLDFGCGNKPFKELIPAEEYIGVDYNAEGKDVDIVYNGIKLPFDDNTFDSIISTEVFEHIFNLNDIIKELHRVLKPGGNMLITIPFAWEEHDMPFDYARYTTKGIENILTKAGFKIINQDRSGNSVTTVFQLWNNYLYKSLPKNFFIRSLLLPVLIFPVNLTGIVASKLLPVNKDLFLSQIILSKAEK